MYVAVIAPPQLLTFRAATRVQVTPPVTIGPLTDRIRVRLRRPTTARPLAWNATSTLRVTLVLRLDGIEYPCVSTVTGGVRANGRGGEHGVYGLEYRPTIQMPTDTVTGRVRIGANDFVRGRRLADIATEVQAFLRFEQLRGANINTELLLAETVEALAPHRIIHQSVAYDADTAAMEEGGDGVITLTHTPAGSSNLAAFGYGGNGETAQTLGAFTYDSVNFVSLWDAAHNTNYRHVGAQLAGIPTGAKTVFFSTISPPDDHVLGVITMTGVHQTTPCGTPVTASGSGASSAPTVTVGSVGADDLVVAGLMEIDRDFESAIGAVGADQTEQWRVNTPSNGQYAAGSTQLGSAGGIMSWALPSQTGANHFWGMGAVAFKSAGGALALDQEGYRWRNDDGSESTATWKAAQDTTVNLAPDTTTRLRMIVNATSDPASAQYKLQYRKVGDASWRDVDKDG